MKKLLLLVIVAMFAGCSDPLEEIDFNQKVKEHEALIERSLESIEMVLSTVRIFGEVYYYGKILDDNTIYYMDQDDKFEYNKYKIRYTRTKYNAYKNKNGDIVYVTFFDSMPSDELMQIFEYYIDNGNIVYVNYLLSDEERVNLYEELITDMFYNIDTYMLVSLNRVYGKIVEKYPSMDSSKLDNRFNECKNLIESNKANYRPYKYEYTGIDPYNS
jgi:hypothetical protein